MQPVPCGLTSKVQPPSASLEVTGGSGSSVMVIGSGSGGGGMSVPFTTHLPEASTAKRASTIKLRKSTMTQEWLKVDCSTVRRRLDTTTEGDENDDDSSDNRWIDTLIGFRVDCFQPRNYTSFSLNGCRRR